MSQLELSRPEVLRVDTPAIRISLGARKALVDMTVGPVGQDHFLRNDGGTFFGTTGWLAIGRVGEKTVDIVHPWKDAVLPNRSAFKCGAGSEVHLYISGVNPSELRFETIPRIDEVGNKLAESKLLETDHQEGEFQRPLGFLVADTDATRWDTYSHRDILSGVAGLERVVVYSALETVRVGRHIQ